MPESFVVEEAARMIRKHEGFRSYAYQDSEGYWTIGYGRLIDKARGGGITKQEANYLLECDMLRTIGFLETELRDIWDELEPARQVVLIDMAFNLGPRGFMGFQKMIAALRANDYNEAAEQMLDSKWAKQVKGRAVQLAQMMRTAKLANG